MFNIFTLWWLFGFLAFVTVILLSQYNDKGFADPSTTTMFVKNFLIHITSLATSQDATYLTSIVKVALYNYLILLRVKFSSPSVKNDPNVYCNNLYQLGSQIRITQRNKIQWWVICPCSLKILKDLLHSHPIFQSLITNVKSNAQHSNDETIHYQCIWYPIEVLHFFRSFRGLILIELNSMFEGKIALLGILDDKYDKYIINISWFNSISLCFLYLKIIASFT